MKKFCCLLFTVILILSFNCTAFASEQDISLYIGQIEKAKIEELEAESIQDMIDKMAEKPAAGNEWWIMSIRNYHEKLDYSLYRSALEQFVTDTPPSSATSQERCALALISLESELKYADQIVDEAIDKGSLNTYIFALHLLNNGVASKYSKEDLISLILSMQCSDGGWSLTSQKGEPDLTAMAIQSLAPYMGEESVEASVGIALDFLSSSQLENGGYTSYGNENPESSAQVIFALSSLGIDAKNDERFIKNGNSLFDAVEAFKVSEGKYAHTLGGDANSTATVQVYYSYIAYEMFLNGDGNFYTFSKLSEEAVERKQTEEKKEINIKLLMYIGIGCVVAILCLIKILKKEKKAKSYLSVLLVGGILALIVNFVNIQNTEQYYKKEDVDSPVFTTISIYCDTIVGKADYVPSDGKILEFKVIEVSDGASVYEQLVLACKEYKIQMESEGSSYINGIANIYEYKFRDLSGWMFKVNGEFSDTGCDQKKLKDGDYVEWVYTTNLGKDVGNEYMVQ